MELINLVVLIVFLELTVLMERNVVFALLELLPHLLVLLNVTIALLDTLNLTKLYV